MASQIIHPWPPRRDDARRGDAEPCRAARAAPGSSFRPSLDTQGTPPISDEETTLLSGLAAELHPADCQILVRLIGKVAELERTRGEEVALAMLEKAISAIRDDRAAN